MAIVDIAEGCRGSKGPITLSLQDTNELQRLISKKQITEGVKIERMRNGGCIIDAADLTNIVFGVEEIVEAPEESPSEIVGAETLTPTDDDPTEELKPQGRNKKK